MMWGALNSKTSIYYCVIRVVVNCRLDFYSLLFHCCFSSNVSLRFVFCILFHWYHAIIITNFKDKSHKKSVHNSSRKKKTWSKARKFKRDDDARYQDSSASPFIIWLVLPPEKKRWFCVTPKRKVHYYVLPECLTFTHNGRTGHKIWK